MKKFIFGLILTFSLSVIGAAQNSGRNQIQAGTSLQAQLQQSLDVKNAKVGDEIILKVSKSIKQNGETVLPKGANIIGRVTQVQQKSKNNGVSRLGVVFDRIQNKNLDAPLSASIVSITQAAVSGNAGDNSDSEILGSYNSSGSVSRGNSRGNSGGGLLGGVSNTVSGVGNTAGGAVNSTANTVGSVANSAGRTVGGTTQSLGRAVSGIQISQSVGVLANGSTTLSSSGKGLKLEKGVTFNLLLNESAGN